MTAQPCPTHAVPADPCSHFAYIFLPTLQAYRTQLTLLQAFRINDPAITDPADLADSCRLYTHQTPLTSADTLPTLSPTLHQRTADPADYVNCSRHALHLTG